MKNINHVPYVICMVLGEFFILLSAVFIGKFFGKDFVYLTDWIFLEISIFSLLSGVVLRYIGEKYGNDDEDNPITRKMIRRLKT